MFLSSSDSGRLSSISLRLSVRGSRVNRFRLLLVRIRLRGRDSRRLSGTRSRVRIGLRRSNSSIFSRVRFIGRISSGPQLGIRNLAVRIGFRSRLRSSSRVIRFRLRVSRSRSDSRNTCVLRSRVRVRLSGSHGSVSRQPRKPFRFLRGTQLGITNLPSRMVNSGLLSSSSSVISLRGRVQRSSLDRRITRALSSSVRMCLSNIQSGISRQPRKTFRFLRRP